MTLVDSIPCVFPCAPSCQQILPSTCLSLSCKVATKRHSACATLQRDVLGKWLNHAVKRLIYVEGQLRQTKGLNKIFRLITSYSTFGVPTVFSLGIWMASPLLNQDSNGKRFHVWHRMMRLDILSPYPRWSEVLQKISLSWVSSCHSCMKLRARKMRYQPKVFCNTWTIPRCFCNTCFLTLSWFRSTTYKCPEKNTPQLSPDRTISCKLSPKHTPLRLRIQFAEKLQLLPRVKTPWSAASLFHFKCLATASNVSNKLYQVQPSTK